jgi:hypothetical protein
MNVEILGSKCFSYWESLSSIRFESNSDLTRIRSGATSHSALGSIVFPPSAQFIDGSALIDVTLSSISIESGNEILVIENDFLVVAVNHKLIRHCSTSSEIEIGMNIKMLGSKAFHLVNHFHQSHLNQIHI